MDVARPKRQVGLADDNGAGQSNGRDNGGIGCWHVVGQLWRATSGLHTSGLDGVLHCDWDTVKRADLMAGCETLVRGSSLLERGTEVRGNDGIDHWVEALDAR